MPEYMKYQLTLQFPTAEIEDFDRLLSIELQLITLLGDKHKVEGHELGAEEMNIFIHTDDPNGVFDIVKKTLTPLELETMKAAFREVNGEINIAVWPKAR
jgi:hypothetical protein